MKTKSYLKHTWCRTGLVVKKSRINANGVFTDSFIKKGGVVFVFGGELITKGQTDNSKYRVMSIFPIDDNLYLGSRVKAKDEYLNHSCDPNVWLADEVTVIAKRDIKPGEEITLDCATWDSDSDWTYSEDGKCTCGSQNCRKDILPEDWKKTDIQEKYKGHFAPYIQKRIDRLNLVK